MITEALLRYAEQHTSPEPDLLKKINRDTHAQVLMPRMLSGHLQGRLLAMISQMVKPNAILEIGTYTGYSALCLAEGLRPGGRLATIDKNEELEERVRGYFAASPSGNQIEYHIGDARQIIPKLSGPFDLVFIDADKENYSQYFDLVIDHVSDHGWIIADNVLWSGKVVEPRPDKDTRAIMEFNEKVMSDKRVACLLLPVRDGLLIMQKL
ncbi:MAG: O-methyltransferase [Cyclobacteriaceae bacterium]|jgi:caffeoyl-CoA O-methyltransferase